MPTQPGVQSGQQPSDAQSPRAALAPDSGRPEATESGQVDADAQSTSAAPAPWLGTGTGWAGMTWRQRARAVIRWVTDQARAEGVTDEKEIIRRIDSAYPFGEREYYPYKAWLMERRIAKGLLRGQLVKGSPDKAVALTAYKPLPELETWLRARGGSL